MRRIRGTPVASHDVDALPDFFPLFRTFPHLLPAGIALMLRLLSAPMLRQPGEDEGSRTPLSFPFFARHLLEIPWQRLNFFVH